MTAPPRNRFDTARADVLVWALGGFAEAPAEATHSKALPQWLCRRLDQLAALPKCPRGALAALGSQSGRTRNCLAAHVYLLRRSYRPQYRGRT